MRRQLRSLLIAAALMGLTACAQGPAGHGQAELEPLFQRLRTTQDPAEAKSLETTIRHAWADSGPDSVTGLMKLAVDGIHAGDTDTALAALDKVVLAAPGYVEGWNLRATVHYLRDEYGPAITDIEHVLRLEPRHYPALAGLGRIMLALDDKQMALRAFQAALAINPHMDGVREEAESLQDELAGQQI